MSWVAVAIMVGTAAAGAYESEQVAHKQDKILASEMAQQQATEKKNAAATAALVQNQKKQPQQTQQTADAAKQQFQQAVKANAAQAAVPLNAVGNVSQAYEKAKKNAALGVADNVSTYGALTANIGAPTRARQANQTNLANYGIGMNLNNQEQQGQNYVDQLKLRSVHTNPYLSLLLSGLSGYAKGSGVAAAGAGGGGGMWSGGGAVTPGVDDTVTGATAGAYA